MSREDALRSVPSRLTPRPADERRVGALFRWFVGFANGMGVTILSDMVYRPWSLDGRRVEVLSLSDPIPTMDVGLAWAANVEQNSAVTTVREFMHIGEEVHVR